MNKRLKMLLFSILLITLSGWFLISCDPVSDPTGGSGGGDTVIIDPEQGEITDLKIIEVGTLRLSLTWTDPVENDLSEIRISYKQNVDPEMGDVDENVVVLVEKGMESINLTVQPFTGTVTEFTIRTVDTSGELSTGVVLDVYFSTKDYESVLYIDDSDPETLHSALSSGTAVNPPYVILDCDFDFSGITWESISNFFGVLMGNGHAIENMGGGNALFTDLGTGYISGLSLTNVNMVYSYGRFGVLVAKENTGTIENCSVQGDIAANGNISPVISSHDNVGLLVSQNSGAIKGCFTSGNITATKDYGENVGGLVGDNSGTISDSYSTASVIRSYENAGGLMGNNSGIVNNSYATGNVSTSFSPGAFVGYSRYNAVYSNCYYDSNKTTKEYTGITGITLTDETQFTGFDFTTVWDMDSTVNNGRPFLRENSPQ